MSSIFAAAIASMWSAQIHPIWNCSRGGGEDICFVKDIADVLKNEDVLAR
jgi:hypothetical protein